MGIENINLYLNSFQCNGFETPRVTFLYHAPTIPAIGISIPVVYEAQSLSR